MTVKDRGKYSSWHGPDPVLPDPPWDRHPKESNRAWEVFQIYRDIPAHDRTYQVAADRVGKTRALVAQWGSRFRWRERVKHWDVERERAFAEGQLEEIRLMGARHAARAAAAIDALMVPLVVVARRISDPASMAELERQPLSDLLKLAAQTVKPIASLIAAERLARGEPTAIERVDVDVGAAMAAPKLAEVISVAEALGLIGDPDEGEPPRLALAQQS